MARTKGSGFKMRGNPFQRNFGISPAKRMDVLIDGESIGTGPDAQAKGIKVEEANKMQRYKQDKAMREWSKNNPNASQDDWAKAQMNIISENPTTDVEYTGKDKDTMEYRKRQKLKKNTPAKDKLEVPMAPNTTEKKKSEKIGPAISDKMRQELLKKRSDEEMNLDVSSDEAFAAGKKVQKEIDEQRKYIKR